MVSPATFSLARITNMVHAIRPLLIVTVGLACLAPFGCGGKPPLKIMHGSVSCGGERVPMGQVVFVPIGNSSASLPLSVAAIADGKYSMTSGSGAPLGKYRVKVDARKKTGQKVRGFNGIEITMVDEVVGMGPKAYAGDQSPLVVEVTADSDGKYDIAMPGK
jgi:hypothetical protein